MTAFTCPSKKEFFNALTVLSILFLLPIDPTGSSTKVYLTCAIILFVTFGTLNHLFPAKLARMTHVVKATYTQLLYAATGFSWSNPAIWAITLFDTLPLLFNKHKRLAQFFESVGFIGRLPALITAFILQNIHSCS